MIWSLHLMSGGEKQEAFRTSRRRIRINSKSRVITRPQRRYCDQPHVLQKIFEDIDKKMGLEAISAKYRCALSTLYRWRKRRQQHPDWLPNKGRTSRNRIFTDEEERQIAEDICALFLNPGLLFTDQEFRLFILERYLEKYVHSDCEQIPAFNCSNGYIYDFKKKHRFSSRRTHPKRRCNVSDADLQHWREQIRELLEHADRDCIINADETSWAMFPSNILTWARTGDENTAINIGHNAKDTLTVLASVTANGGRLPLYILAKGTTEKVLASQLGDTFGHWRNFSENGWQTSATFETYLMHIREHYNDQQVHLILDLHASHRTDSVKTLARELNIKLWYIPPGCTDLVQPLDVRCFGTLKSTARRLWREQLARAPEKRFTKQDAVAILIAAWEHLGTDTIEEAWEIADEKI